MELEGLEEINELARRLARVRTHMQPKFAEVGNIITNATDQAFEEEGPNWRPLAVSTYHLGYTNLGRSKSKKTHTKKGKVTRGFERYIANKKILQRSGRLRDSITVHATDTDVTVGTNLPYAAVHQFGGMAGRGRKVKIPSRPYLPIAGNTLRADVAKSIAGYLTTQIEKDIL